MAALKLLYEFFKRRATFAHLPNVFVLKSTAFVQRYATLACSRSHAKIAAAAMRIGFC
jgi:hypothetical protein